MYAVSSGAVHIRGVPSVYGPAHTSAARERRRHFQYCAPFASPSLDRIGPLVRFPFLGVIRVSGCNPRGAKRCQSRGNSASRSPLPVHIDRRGRANDVYTCKPNSNTGRRTRRFLRSTLHASSPQSLISREFSRRRNMPLFLLGL